jgi:hypothetical protein
MREELGPEALAFAELKIQQARLIRQLVEESMSDTTIAAFKDMCFSEIALQGALIDKIEATKACQKDFSECDACEFNIAVHEAEAIYQEKKHAYEACSAAIDAQLDEICDRIADAECGLVIDAARKAAKAKFGDNPPMIAIGFVSSSALSGKDYGSGEISIRPGYTPEGLPIQ